MPTRENADRKVLRRTLKQRRRRGLLVDRLGEAHTASQRVGAAAAYLRSALEKAPREVADLVAATTVELLVKQADEVFKASRRRVS